MLVYQIKNIQSVAALISPSQNEINYQNASFDKAVEYLKQANKLKLDDYERIVNPGNASFDGGNYAKSRKMVFGSTC